VHELVSIETNERPLTVPTKKIVQAWKIRFLKMRE